MNLVITAVHGHGDQQQERVQLDAVGACDLGHYILADTTYVGPNVVSNRVRHTHWFGDKPLNKGDTVLLHTRQGTANKTQRLNGTMVYSVFWGLDVPVWNDTGDAAVLLRVADWSHAKVK